MLLGGDVVEERVHSGPAVNVSCAAVALFAQQVRGGRPRDTAAQHKVAGDRGVAVAVEIHVARGERRLFAAIDLADRQPREIGHMLLAVPVEPAAADLALEEVEDRVKRAARRRPGQHEVIADRPHDEGVAGQLRDVGRKGQRRGAHEHAPGVRSVGDCDDGQLRPGSGLQVVREFLRSVGLLGRGCVRHHDGVLARASLRDQQVALRGGNG